MGDYGDYQRGELRRVDAVATKTVMMRNYPGNASFAFLIVEGTTDKNLYQTYVNTTTCQIIVAYGRDNAKDLLTILERESFKGVLAIVDADFDVLEEQAPHSPHLLFTDTHDLETMLIQSPALEKVLAELGSEEKLTRFVTMHKKDMRTFLLEYTRLIGYLRWISLREKLSLKFEDMDFSKFVDKDTLKIDNVLKLIRNVQSRSSEKTVRKQILDTELQNKIKQLKSDAHDPWHVCCGHDIVGFLAFGLRKAIGTVTVEPEMLEICLRLAYEQSYFRQTKLYISIRQWETSNMPFIALTQEVNTEE